MVIRSLRIIPSFPVHILERVLEDVEKTGFQIYFGTRNLNEDKKEFNHLNENKSSSHNGTIKHDELLSTKEII